MKLKLDMTVKTFLIMTHQGGPALHCLIHISLFPYGRETGKGTEWLSW